MENLKRKLKDEGGELSEKIGQLKMVSSASPIFTGALQVARQCVTGDTKSHLSVLSANNRGKKLCDYFCHSISLQTTDRLPYQPLINGYNFSELYGRWQRQAAGFLLHFVEPVLKFFSPASVGAYGGNNDISVPAIELVSGNNQSRSLFVSRKIGEGKGYQNNIAKFARLYRRLRHQDYSKIQTTARQVSLSQSRQDQYAGDVADAPKIAVAFQPALLKWPLQLLSDFETFAYSLLPIYSRSPSLSSGMKKKI